MRRVEPKVFLVGETRMDLKAVKDYFTHVGTNWWEMEDGSSDSEKLIEIMGRMCYKSWEPGLNKNITKIRKGNTPYIGNIIKQKHGSVLEHGVSNWIVADVSRVFTHELIRHRAGTAFSQESLRYVRLDDLGLWIPPEVTDPQLIQWCEEKFRSDETWLRKMTDYLKLDDPGKDFAYKKHWTSFLRRFAPDGVATAIGLSINMRSIRHVVEYRTAEGAETEIRFVFDKIAKVACERWPAVMQDFKRTEQGEWKPEHSKV